VARRADFDGHQTVVTQPATEAFTNPIRELRIAAVVEATTFLVLIGGAITFRVFNGPRLGPTIGPIHGAAFIAYAVAALRARSKQHWSLLRTLIIIGAAVIPIGGYLVAHRLGGNLPATSQPHPEQPAQEAI
jgi:integral membrane protein